VYLISSIIQRVKPETTLFNHFPQEIAFINKALKLMFVSAMKISTLNKKEVYSELC